MTARRIHLAHDWLVGLRGGERVLDRLARQFGPTRLYTLVNDAHSLTTAIDSCTVKTSFLQRLPGATGRLRRWYLPLMPLAVRRLRVEPCDLLISTSSAVMKSIVPPQGVPHLCYCHSPARYIWGQTDDYAGGAGGRLRSLGLRGVRRRFQKWDRATAAGVTHFLANSRHIAREIERCYGRQADVVHPPVRTGFFTPEPQATREDWFLVVSALEPYKRVDLAIEAANHGGFHLKIAGDGSQRDALEAPAGPSVEFMGRVSDEELRSLFRRAQALIHPQREDFGIIAVEAQACGCPVIAFGAGGALDSVTNDTGLFFEEQNPESLIDAVTAFGQREFHIDACRANAERFSEDAFDRAIGAQVDRLLSG